MISRNNFCLIKKFLHFQLAGWMAKIFFFSVELFPQDSCGRHGWRQQYSWNTRQKYINTLPYMHLQLFRQLLVLQLAAETRNRKSALHWNVAQAEFFFILSGGFWIFFPSFTQTSSSKKHLIFGMCLKCSIKIRIMRQTANCISQNAKCEMQREKREIKTSSVRIRNVH